MGEAIDISWGEDEAATELHGMPTQFVLLMAGCAGTVAAPEIVEASQVRQIGGT